MKKTAQIIFIISFILIIGFPLIFQFTVITKSQISSENRKLTTLPKFEWNNTNTSTGNIGRTIGVYRDIITFKDRFDLYLSDQFILKKPLFKLYQKIKLEMLKKDPLPYKTIKGNNDWWFLGDSYSGVIRESMGIEVFSTSELEIIKNNIDNRVDWLQERDIEYLISVAPNKQTVYKQHFPISYAPGLTKSEQILDLEIDDIELVNLGELFGQHDHIRLYHKTDTHWNAYGAFIGYLSLMESINDKFPHIKALSIKDYKIDTSSYNEGDLTRMLGLSVDENLITMTPLFQSKYKLKPNPFSNDPGSILRSIKSHAENPGKTATVLLIGDSFSDQLFPYLCETFGSCYLTRSYEFDRELIEHLNPDLVIQQLVERKVDELLSNN